MKVVRLKTKYEVKPYTKGMEDGFIYELKKENPDFNPNKPEKGKNQKYFVSRYNKEGYENLVKKKVDGKKRYYAKQFTKLPIMRTADGSAKLVNKDSIILTEVGTFKRLVVTEEELKRNYEETNS